MQIETSKLTGPALDWAVAKCEYVHHNPTQETDWFDRSIPSDIARRSREAWTPDDEVYMLGGNYSTDWAQGGPIIERSGFSLETFKGIRDRWGCFDLEAGHAYSGPTPLIAAMRCYVASKLGDVVDVPDELAGGC